jgi:cell division protein FtsQ
MKNHIIKILPVLGLAVLLLLLGFVTRHQNHMPCRGAEIHLHSDAALYFIDHDDVYHQIINAADSLEGQAMISINTQQIENTIEMMPEVKKADVFKTIDGKIKANIDLRVPLARIFATDGQSFYLDEDGKEMPLSTKNSARVMAVNGRILSAQSNTLNPDKHLFTWTEQREEIHRLARYIASDSFWKAQIQQVYVDENLEYVLIPRVGNHEIQFGKMDDLEIKFKKLKAFYEQALSKSDWNQYQSVNLKYKNQIVCKKK